MEHQPVEMAAYPTEGNPLEIQHVRLGTLSHLRGFVQLVGIFTKVLLVSVD